MSDKSSFEFDTGTALVRVTAKWITPSEAADLLKFHSANRAISSKSVEAIKADIENDLWVFNGDTIGFATTEEGQVVGTNGQHRLTAIARGDVSVPVLIVENLDPCVTDTIDQGRPRTVADILKLTYGLSRIKNVNVVTSMATILAGNGNSTLMQKNTRKAVAAYAFDNIQALETFSAWSVNTCRDCLEFTHPTTRKRYAALTASPLGALAYYMVNQGANYDLVTEFFQRISSGVTTESDNSNVIQAIRKRQNSGKALSRMSTSAGPSSCWFLVEFYNYVNAYNRWISGEYTSKIQSPSSFPLSLSDLPRVTAAHKKEWN